MRDATEADATGERRETTTRGFVSGVWTLTWLGSETDVG